jgi:hypothetical protein
MTYIKELIDLPDRVRRGDFVLRLTEGVTKPKETVESYVVTPQLVNCFDEAMSLVRSAVEARSSKACYLHGSFGSGKSHFMAILHLILTGNADARSIPELVQVVNRHNDWTEGKKFLLVPYHMIGAENMETAILGGYVDHILRVHPEAHLPGVYRADIIFQDAVNLRQAMGDAAFFEKLNQGAAAGGGWGDIGAGWEAASFDAAMVAPPRSEDRVRLVGELVEKFFTSVRGSADSLVSLDEGLSIISKHARALGYEALVLFLDELILWLATRAGDVAFVNREGPKVSKLVEAQTAERPAPIISFVARQRDLKELVGTNLPGAEKLNFSDILDYWEARFSKITLEDRNLPDIAAKRVLKPNSEAARQVMDTEFAKTASIRQEVMDVLVTSQANREMFRKVYPFSPALVETLVAVSFLLQRERTALKVMLQLLVEQRDRLKLGDIVPVGDLFDAISEGDEAFSEVMKTHFENAKKLYYQKLRPLIELENGVRFDELEKLPADDKTAVALRNDDRLVKTLLLAALAPNVESLRGLTATRLAALNHGTIKTPIPGQEGRLVLQKCRKWAAEIGQIKIGEETTNPTISIQLTGVDTELIIKQADNEDNAGNRVRKIKELLFAELGIEPKDELFLTHDFKWRATARTCEVLVTNVREAQDSAFKKEGETWRVLIDYPFDMENRSPRDDLATLDNFRSRNEGVSRAIVWVPSFFSALAQRELGTLVKLDHILTGERFANYVTQLSLPERSDAKTLLENQRSQLRQRLTNYLAGAYGLATPEKGSIDTSHDLTPADHFQSLDDSLTLQTPVGANLKQGFEKLLDQALQHQYPAHPIFDDDTNLGAAVLKRILAEVERAAQDAQGRIPVEQGPRRKELKQIANPLRLGQMHETHFVIEQHWRTHFMKMEARDGGQMTVTKLRSWVDEPAAMGLPKLAQNLVILAFAAQTNRSFFLHGGPYNATLDSLPDDLELREQRLPTQADWDVATDRSAKVFGIASSPLVNAANVARFVDEVKKVATESKEACAQLVGDLRRLLPGLSEAGTDATRYKTAQAAHALITQVLAAGDGQVVEAIAGAKLEATEEAIGRSMKKAADVVAALATVKWTLFAAIDKLEDGRRDAASGIRQALREAVESDEYALALAPALSELEDRAARLLSDVPKPIIPPTVPPVPPLGKPVPPTYKVLASGGADNLSEADFNEMIIRIKGALKEDKSARLKVSWEVFKK